MTKAVALGDLSKQIEVDARGEILDLKNTVNGMVVRFAVVILLKILQLIAPQITSACGGSHSSHSRSRKSRKTWGSSTCTGRGRGVVEFGSKREYLFNNAFAEGFLMDL